MNTAEYHKMHDMERTYWWFQGRRRIILTVLDEALQAVRSSASGRPLRLLDAGCGTGMLLDDLRKCGWAAGLDLSPVALAYSRQRNLTDLARADVTRLPIASSTLDVVTALDIVEHIPDDKATASELHRVLRPGGIAVFAVPAHPHLWSAHDVALQHVRRYRARDFRSLLINAGFQILRFTPSMATVYPAVAAYRTVKRMFYSPGSVPHTDEFPLPTPVNSALKAVCDAEAAWLRRHNLPFGVSLIAIARRN